MINSPDTNLGVGYLPPLYQEAFADKASNYLNPHRPFDRIKGRLRLIAHHAIPEFIGITTGIGTYISDSALTNLINTLGFNFRNDHLIPQSMAAGLVVYSLVLLDGARKRERPTLPPHG